MKYRKLPKTTVALDNSGTVYGMERNRLMAYHPDGEKWPVYLDDLIGSSMDKKNVQAIVVLGKKLSSLI